ncbi:hypothetical protein BGX30_010097 [Mortierella sp. GBA39]|nr:hypothetical protein BGX30_010097 [Mortierella sp. GBA39]
MGWRRIGIIYSSNSFGVSFATSIVRRAPYYGVMVTHWDATHTPDNDSQDFKDVLGMRIMLALLLFGDGGSGGGNESLGGNGNNVDYNQFRTGIFSFGIKDDTQTVPVLIIDMRGWRWLLQFTARWRAKQTIVVSSLNMAIISDGERNLSCRLEKSGGLGYGNGCDGARGGGSGDGDRMGGEPLSTTTPVNSLNLHGNHPRTRPSRNPFTWIQRHQTSFESAGPEVHALEEEESCCRGGSDRFRGKGGFGADGDKRYDNDNSWMQSSGLTYESSSSSDIDLSSLSASVLPSSFSETAVDPQTGKKCTGQEPNDQQQSNVPRQNNI